MNYTPSETPNQPANQFAGSEEALNQETGLGQLTNGATPNSAMDVNQRARVATANFGEIVALLSFSPVYKHLSLSDLEWLVIPALATNRVTTVRGKLKDQNGLMIPIGLAFWADVSGEVDKKLEAQQQANMPFRLAPQEWKSGEIPWLLAVIAPDKVTQALMKKLEETVFKDKTYKVFSRTMGSATNEAGKENVER